MLRNPQSGTGSASSSSGGGDGQRRAQRAQKGLPPLFWYMETGDWAKATERAKRHPREVKTWACLRTKSLDSKISGAKRMALHHACFKLRSSVSSFTHGTNSTEDPFISVCRFILLLLQIYPEAASQRESRHGCLPLHLAAFASCTRSSQPDDYPDGTGTAPTLSPTSFSLSSLSSTLPSIPSNTPSLLGPRPGALTNAHRSVSESTTDTVNTNMSNVLAEEYYTGNQTYHQTAVAAGGGGNHHRRSSSLESSPDSVAVHIVQPPTVSVAMPSNIFISEKRQEYAVKVLNALLDAFPRGIRMDSEGGRLPLHTACAGRATPRVISTLVTAYAAAARHRNKDGFLPLHLCAHWGISHANVATTILKAYPDATFGRNRWERTPLEEALCMAGENGRPHQEALVRALRKHPSYWTRPEKCFQTTSPREGNQIVDTDATLPSNGDESTVEELKNQFQADLLDLEGRKGGFGLFRKGKKQNEIEFVEASPSNITDLPTLIKNQNWDGVLHQLRVNPCDADEELHVTTRGGFTSTSGFMPLHFACERRPPLEVIEALIAACPGAVMSRAMPGGALPLHIACTWYAPASAISALLVADKTACKMPDELGNVPLHSACFSGTSTAVIESILRAYPKSVLGRNHQGSLPEDICKRLRHDNRRPVLGILNIVRVEIVLKKKAKHAQKHSSGSIQEMANEAIAINQRDGPPMMSLEDHVNVYGEDPALGVEVSYGAGNQELVWI